MRSLVVLLALLVACKREDKPMVGPAVAPPLRLWTDAELGELEASLMKRLDANAKRSCVRPVLRGTKLTGPAGPELVALVEPTGSLAGCMHKIQVAEQGGKLAELVEQRAPHLVSLDADCGPDLEKAVLAIVAHEDACTPYLTGVRAEPAIGVGSLGLMPALRTARMLGLRARLRAEAGDVHGALWLLLDATRAFQDLGRGETFLIVSMIATAAENIVIEQMQRIMSTLEVPPAAIPELTAAFDALFASEPPFADVLRGETDYAALHMGLARTKPASWKPPGGRTDSSASNESETGSKMSPADEGAMMQEFGERLSALGATACPATASLATCWSQLTAAVEKAAAQPRPMSGAPHELALQLVAKIGDKTTPEAIEQSRREIKKLVVDVLVVEAAPMYPAYVAKRAITVARLAAARIHLEAQRLGRCPSDAELDSPRFMALRKPAVLGDALVPERTKTHLIFHAPEWTAPKQPVGQIRCD